MTALRLPDTCPADATMEFHVAFAHGAVKIFQKGDDLSKYEPIDLDAVAARRRADINAGRSMAPRYKCHFCDHAIGKGALWCSTGCADAYALERQAINRAA